MNHLTYVIGVPGSGKSTAMAAATASLEASPRNPKGSPAHVLYLDHYLEVKAVQLGGLREKFSGTDALSMSVQPLAISWLSETQWPYLVAEGDRLNNHSFYVAAMRAGYRVEIAWLDLPDEVAQQRREARGSRQDAQWLAGRVTKVKNIVGAMRDKVTRIDATQAPGVVAQQLRLFRGFAPFNESP